MYTEDRIYRSIQRRKDDVFVRSEIAALGSEAQISRALRNLISRGVIVKLGVGVYAKAKKSLLSGNPIPVKPVGELAPLVLEKLGVKTFATSLTQDYNQGLSMQLPAGNSVNIGRSRISRKIGFGLQTISYEKHQR
jgi:hypothetical protein